MNSVRSNLKLSQLLNMYYSTKGVFSTDVKSCKRRDFYEQIAPINALKDQVYFFLFIVRGWRANILAMLLISKNHFFLF